jgi:hypothetical protein
MPFVQSSILFQTLISIFLLRSLIQMHAMTLSFELPFVLLLTIAESYIPVLRVASHSDQVDTLVQRLSECASKAVDAQLNVKLKDLQKQIAELKARKQVPMV